MSWVKKMTSTLTLQKKLELNVEFVDEMPQELLKKYYAQCDCLVVPSLSEDFCLPVIKAALFCKPSIVSEVGSLPELVIDSETGFIIKAKDAVALAKKCYFWPIIVNYSIF